jgi:hypothetical protein
LASLSLTQTAALTTLRSFILGVLPPGIEVVKGLDNRVPEPKGIGGGDFCVMTPLFQKRLSYNIVDFTDTIITGSVSGTTLTVADVTQSQAPIAIGHAVIDTTGLLAANTLVTAYGTGSGGIGTYTVSPSQTVAGETMYVDMRSDLVPTELTVQIDVHGPNSTDNTKILEGLLVSSYSFSQFLASGFDIQALYCEDARQMPFINAEDQYELRWSLDAVLQINPVIATPTQFFDHIALAATQVSDMAQSSVTAAGQVFQPVAPFYPQFSVGGSFADMAVSEWDGNYELFNMVLPFTGVLPSNLYTSPVPLCLVPPARTATLYLQWISGAAATVIATLVIPAGMLSGSWSTNGAVTIPRGDRLRMMAPADIDTGMIGLAGTIIGTYAS